MLWPQNIVSVRMVQNSEWWHSASCQVADGPTRAAIFDGREAIGADVALGWAGAALAGAEGRHARPAQESSTLCQMHGSQGRRGGCATCECEQVAGAHGSCNAAGAQAPPARRRLCAWRRRPSLTVRQPCRPTKPWPAAARRAAVEDRTGHTCWRGRRADGASQSLLAIEACEKWVPMLPSKSGRGCMGGALAQCRGGHRRSRR